MIAIVNYDVGNLFSLYSSFKFIGEDVVIAEDNATLKASDRIILPGVGAFGDAKKKLDESGLKEALLEEVANGKPLLGICLGMQLLFDESYEYGHYEGLGLIKGSIAPIKDVAPSDLKIPHIGWNALHFPIGKEKSCLFKYINEGDFVYFVHSFYGRDCNSSLIATTEYGAELTAAVADKNVFGTQFHPEKSGDVGLNILRAFCEI